MIVTDLMFKIELDYQLHQFMPLACEAKHHIYNPDTKRYEWIFSVKDVDEVAKILAKVISFEGVEKDIQKAISLCPPLKARIESERWKGKGETTITEEPDVFVIGEWQKDPKTGKPSQAFHSIPKQIVRANWEVIKKQPLDKFVKIRTIAEHLGRSLGFKRFFRENDTFDWEKWIGAHRKAHLPYCYYPIKILSHYGAIEYSRVGKVKRIKEDFEVK